MNNDEMSKPAEEKDKSEHDFKFTSDQRKKEQAAYEFDIRQRLKHIFSQNFFDLFGIDYDGSDDELKKRYYEITTKIRNPRFYGKVSDELAELADEIFDFSTFAYSILSHPKKRAAYLERLQATPAKLTEEQKEYAQLLFKKGQDALAKKQWDESLEHFKEARKLNGQKGEYLIYLGWAMFRKMESEKKSGFLEPKGYILQGMRQSPQLVQPYKFLSKIAQLTNRKQAALTYLKSAIPLAEHDDELLKEIAQLRGQVMINRQRSDRAKLSPLEKKLSRIFSLMKLQTYYALLNVPETADEITIKLAYQKRQKELHQDNFAGKVATDFFHVIANMNGLLNKAYSTLTNNSLKKEYDEQLKKKQQERSASVDAKPEE